MWVSTLSLSAGIDWLGGWVPVLVFRLLVQLRYSTCQNSEHVLLQQTVCHKEALSPSCPRGDGCFADWPYSVDLGASTGTPVLGLCTDLFRAKLKAQHTVSYLYCMYGPYQYGVYRYRYISPYSTNVRGQYRFETCTSRATFVPLQVLVQVSYVCRLLGILT